MGHGRSLPGLGIAQLGFVTKYISLRTFTESSRHQEGRALFLWRLVFLLLCGLFSASVAVAQPSKPATCGSVIEKPEAALESVRNYKVTSMQKDFLGEEQGRSQFYGAETVTYLTDSEQNRAKVTVNKQGQLQQNGSVIGSPESAVRSASEAQSEAGEVDFWLYVMLKDGTLLMAEMKSGLHHSSLSRGQPVAGAGIIVIEKGLVAYIDNCSGHYTPGPAYLLQVIEELYRKGARFEQLQISALLGEEDEEIWAERLDEKISEFGIEADYYFSGD